MLGLGFLIARGLRGCCPLDVSDKESPCTWVSSRPGEGGERPALCRVGCIRTCEACILGGGWWRRRGVGSAFPMRPWAEGVVVARWREGWAPWDAGPHGALPAPPSGGCRGARLVLPGGREAQLRAFGGSVQPAGGGLWAELAWRRPFPLWFVVSWRPEAESVFFSLLLGLGLTRSLISLIYLFIYLFIYFILKSV